MYPVRFCKFELFLSLPDMIAMKCTALDARISFVNFENSSESMFPLFVYLDHVNFCNLNLFKPFWNIECSLFKAVQIDMQIISFFLLIWECLLHQKTMPDFCRTFIVLVFAGKFESCIWRQFQSACLAVNIDSKIVIIFS